MLRKIKGIAGSPAMTLAAALACGAPVTFWNAFRYSPPMGYAGMFSLMAELIVNAGFGLPMEVPYYGPGGVPFAYPPLGLYLLAVFIQVTGKTLIILRFIPPLLSLLALIPLFFLAIEISGSRLVGFVAVFLASVSLELHIPHAWAAGIVRAPAFGFSLLTLFFYLRAVREFHWRELAAAGVAFGAVILTHLSYALFTALWIVLWTLFHPRWKNWMIASGVALIGLLVGLPWISLMLSRYGPAIFLGALDSHGSGEFLSSLGSLEQVLSRIWVGIRIVLKDQLFTLLIGLGSFIQIVRRRLALPMVFIASIFFLSDGERFVFTIGFLLAGIGVAEVMRLLLNWLKKWNYSLAAGVASLFMLGISAYFWFGGLDRINNYSPRLDSTTLELGEFFQHDTAPNSIYLALTPQDEAEWMPYLFRRQPLVAQWGSEWLGTYNEQVVKMIRTRACKDAQDLDCLKEFFLETGAEPDYLVVLQSDTQLVEQISDDADWNLVHENSRYIVWRNEDQ